MFKLEVEVASIYYFIDGILSPINYNGILTKINSYFKEVPEDMLTPAVYYPLPRQDSFSWSTNAFKRPFTMYVNFFDHESTEAYMMAKNVQDAILAGRCKIPVVDENGEKTSSHFRVGFPTIDRVENGVWELQLTWDRYTQYTDAVVTMAQQYFMNGNTLGG